MRRLDAITLHFVAATSDLNLPYFQRLAVNSAVSDQTFCGDEAAN